MPADRRHVRLIDIAERLGISKVSVSKALRGQKDMAPATRDLIRKTAAEMGYVPNLLAQSLLSKRSNIIGVVVPKIRHAFFAEVIASIQEGAAQLGYEIVLGVSQEDASVEARHIETLLSMRVDGLLVSTTRDARRHGMFDRAAAIGVPLVFFDRAPVAGTAHPSVLMADEDGAYSAIARAVARGCRRIAHLAGPATVNIGVDRRRGYERALAAHGLAVDPDLVVEGGFDEIDGYRGFGALWRSEKRPDAIYCVSAPVALGALDAMRAAAPEAVGRVLMIFFGLRDSIRFLPPPYLCIAQPAERIGREAIDSLMIAIAGGAPAEVRLPVEVVSDSDPVTLSYLGRPAET